MNNRRKNIINTPMTNKMRKRLNVVMSIFLSSIMVYIIGNLFYRSIIVSEKYRTEVAAQQVKSIEIEANRGFIYDKNKEVLASSYTVWDVIVSPATIYMEEKKGKADRAVVAKKIADALEMPHEEVAAKLEKTNSSYEYIKKKVDKEMADRIRDLIINDEDIKSGFVTLEENTKRNYPNNSLAAQVIGFTNSDNQGAYGLEAYYNGVLSGVPGKVLTAVDVNGTPIPTSYEKQYEPVDGKSIVLTLDTTIQNYVEQAINDVVAKHDPKGVSAIVMDVNTGGILAMANYPTFDLNKPYEIMSKTVQEKYDNPTEWIYYGNNGKPSDPSVRGEYVPLKFESEEKKKEYQNQVLYSQWKNDSISSTYMPGSVFKIVTGSAALEEGKFGYKNETYFCTGHYEVLDTSFNCHKRTGHGALGFNDIVANSCNPAFIEMAQRLGVEKFNKYLDSFGIKSKTGIDLGGEIAGISYENDMSLVDLASESFGQALTVTPIQMITAVSAAVNGGYLMEPYIVDSVLDNEGNVVEQNKPNLKRQVISQEVSAEIRSSMEAMIEASSVGKVDGYRIGGKSGTSQINNEKATGRYIGSFIGVAPADKPKVAVLVVVNEPKIGGAYYGAQVAGPAVESIMTNILPYLEIEKNSDAKTVEEPIVPTLINKSVEEAQSILSSQGYKVEVVGDGKTVLDQVPKGGVLTMEGSKVLLYTSSSQTKKAKVPNVVGMSINEAKVTLISQGFNVSMENNALNNAKVISQNIQAGTEQDIGTVVSIRGDTDSQIVDGIM